MSSRINLSDKTKGLIIALIGVLLIFLTAFGISYFTHQVKWNNVVIKDRNVSLGALNTNIERYIGHYADECPFPFDQPGSFFGKNKFFTAYNEYKVSKYFCMEETKHLASLMTQDERDKFNAWVKTQINEKRGKQKKSQQRELSRDRAIIENFLKMWITLT